MTQHYMFTSESVTPGHPDKLCDRISDAIVDAYLKQDAAARVRAECAASVGVLFIAARDCSQAQVDLPEVARRIIREVGYTEKDFNADDCAIMTNVAQIPRAGAQAIDAMSLPDDALDTIVANSQVTVFGFACNETPELMPLPIALAHRLARRLYEVGRSGEVAYLQPDGKTQVGVDYRDGKPARIHSISLTASHSEGVDLGGMQDELYAAVVEPVFRDQPMYPDAHADVFVNRGGLFIGGGPAQHSGLTGRKTGVDTYGEYARHSGAALSGKDPLRIDRAAAYAARHAAKNVVAAQLAEKCELQVSYTLGQSRPVSVHAETFGTGRLEGAELVRRIERHFDFRPAAIVRRFDLQRLPAAGDGFYERLACYGQMGRTDLHAPWEATDASESLL